MSSVLLLGLAGCGRIAFDEQADARPETQTSGVLDPTFGTDGVSVFGSAPTFNIFDLAARNAGYVLAGTRKVTMFGRMVLVGVTSSGQLDTSFAGGGIEDVGTTGNDFGYGVINTGSALAVIGDGGDPTNLDQIQLGMFDFGGAPLPAFNGNGYVTLGGAGQDTSTAMRFTRGGKLVFAGTLDYDKPDSELWLGEVGLDGMATVSAPQLFPGLADFAFDLTLLPDDSMVVAGGLDQVGMFAAKFTTFSTVDPSFGTGGVVTTTDQTSATGIALLDNGDLALVGFGLQHAAVLILAPDGTPRGPTLTIPVGDGSVLRGVAAIANGFVAVGDVTHGGQTNGLVLQFRNDGTLDPTFATGGVLEVDTGADEILRGILVETGGRLVVAGTTTTAGVSSALVARVQ